MNKRDVTVMMQSARREAQKMWEDFMSSYERRPNAEAQQAMAQAMMQLQQQGQQENQDGENLYSQGG